MDNSNYYVRDNSDIEKTKLDAAQNLVANGNFAGALKLYLDMVNTSYSYKLYFETGKCYYKLNDSDNAIIYFNRSIELESNKNPSYTFLGNIYYRTGDVDKAIEYWMIAHSFKPDDENVCLNLATSYFSKEMRFQAIQFYQKFLKYTKNKQTAHYLEVKRILDSFMRDSETLYQKALRALSAKDYETAIQALDMAVKTYPNKFDSNFLLGKLYFDKKDYFNALIYFKQAAAIDKKSLDVLQKIPVAMTNSGDLLGAYCALKRLIPLVLHNQKEYLNVISAIKQLENNIDFASAVKYLENAEGYYNSNNYYYAFLEYENYLILGQSIDSKINMRIQNLRRFLNPEERIIKTCFDKGSTFYSAGDYRTSNKYFTKIMTLSRPESSEYKLAKSRIVNV